MVNAVQLYRGQTRNFTRGYATMDTIKVNLTPGQALVLNRGFNRTTFVKCGTRRVHWTRVLNLKVGETAVVHC